MMSSETSSGSTAHSYRPDIDGLRAIAVLPVLLFHARLGCKGGFLGVDVFFVISGFLISSLILTEVASDAFRLSGFWQRRIRRILPALLVVVLATVAASFFLFLPQDFQEVGESVISQAVLASNVFFWRTTGYFGGDAGTKPLLHTWSLAVEEQFYLLFPLLLVFLTRRKSIPVSKIILALIVASLLLRLGLSHSHASAAFYLLPTRAWELLTGAWLAVTPGAFPTRKVARELCGWLGLSFVCGALIFFDEHTRSAAVPACLGTALIIVSSRSQPSHVGRILRFKPLVFVGLISYSLYLWHWPLLVFSGYRVKETPAATIRVAILIIAFVVSVLSWKYIETPFRKRLVFRSSRQIFSFALVSMALLALLGFIAYTGDGFPSRFPGKAIVYAKSKHHSAFVNIVSVREAADGQFAPFGVQDTNRPITVLIWGDSHAMSLTPVLDELCRRSSQRGVQATCSATPPVNGYLSAPGLGSDSPAFAEAVLSYVTRKHVKNVILAAYWSMYPASDSLKTNLIGTVRALMASGSRVFVIKDVPVPGFDVPRFVALTVIQHGDITHLGITQESHRNLNAGWDETFNELSRIGASVLDPAGYFLNEKGIYEVVRDDQVLYTDSHHLTVEGSKLLAPLFEPVFRSQ